jgi:hypothetical protein
MASKKLILLTTCVTTVVVLSACSSPYYRRPIDIEAAKYWQRKNASSALYLQGPKAQQTLHMDIATCTREIEELQNLGEIRRALPANYNTGNTLEERTASQQELDHWDSPQRDGYLYGEHLEYHDFETCMDSKGWERVEYLPYDEADIARKNYMERYSNKKPKRNMSDREVVTTLNPHKQNPPPYENTNE